MIWLGKLMGGTFGFLFGGPLGAVLGAAVGHQLDRDKKPFFQSRIRHKVKQGIQESFLTATFTVMGHIAKADGRISEAEIQIAREIMTRMQLPPNVKKTAIHLFNIGKEPHFAFEETLYDFSTKCGKHLTVRNMFVEIQVEAALAEGTLCQEKERLLHQVCQCLHLSWAEFENVVIRLGRQKQFRHFNYFRYSSDQKELVQNGFALRNAYRLLGVSAHATEKEIKHAYRRLMSQYHPDKLAAQGMTDHSLRLATEKTQEIRQAYELILKTRKFFN